MKTSVTPNRIEQGLINSCWLMFLIWENLGTKDSHTWCHIQVVQVLLKRNTTKLTSKATKHEKFHLNLNIWGHFPRCVNWLAPNEHVEDFGTTSSPLLFAPPGNYIYKRPQFLGHLQSLTANQRQNLGRVTEKMDSNKHTIPGPSLEIPPKAWSNLIGTCFGRLFFEKLSSSFEFQLMTDNNFNLPET